MKLKRHPVQFYFAIIFGTLFFWFLGIVIIFVDTDESFSFTKFLGFILLILPIILIRLYYKNVPIIEINEQRIWFNGKESYALKEIKNISSNAKLPFRFIIPHFMEGIEITFNNGESRDVFDMMYTNTWELKAFLDQVVKQEKTYEKFELKAIDEHLVSNENLLTYKGNALINYRALTGLFLHGLTFFILITNPSILLALILITFNVFLFCFTGRMLNYIQLNIEHIIIKNHYFLWKNKVFAINQIKEVVLDCAGHNAPNTIMITTIDYKWYRFFVSTLSDKTLKALYKQLRKQKIKTRNELYF